MKIAVLGASGFIGKNFIQQLVRNHITPRVIVRNKNVCIEGCDVVYVKSFTVKNLKPVLHEMEVVVNFIGRFPQPFSTQLATNVDVVFTICQSLDYKHIKQFIHLSAAAAYGACDIPPKETKALSPDTTYGLSKQIGEEIILHFHKTYHLPYVIFRPTNVYGADASQGVIYNMVSSAKKHSVVQVTGNGQRIRDFIHVDDAVAAIMGAIRLQKVNVIYNLSSQQVLEVRELASQIIKQVNPAAHIEYIEENATSIKKLTADNSQLRTQTGWKPTWTLHRGIDQVAQSV